MELVQSRFTIRSWRPGDVDSLVQNANNRRVWRNLTDRFPHPYTREDAVQWIEKASRAVPETNFAIEVGGAAVGGIGFELKGDIERRAAQIGYWLGEPYWGRGIATEALRALSDHAFRHFDLCRLHACVMEWNPASARVLEKAGYVLEGRSRKAITKDGQTIDGLLYARVLEGG